MASCGLGILDGPEADGQITFWMDRDIGHGYIEIEVEGDYAGTLTDFISGGDPECGTSGTVTHTVSKGSHSYVATAEDGTIWRGQEVVEASGCTTVELR